MMVGKNGNGQFVDEVPTRWSRRWFDEPAVGTQVFLGDGLVEVYVGCGIWQTVSGVRPWLSWLSPRRRRGSQGDRLASRSKCRQSENARPRERDPDKPEAEREPKRHHGRKIREAGDLGGQSCDT